MKEIKVIVKDRNTLALQENASEGDYIRLDHIANVDTSFIDALLNGEKEKEVKERILEAERKKEESLNTAFELRQKKEGERIVQEWSSKVQKLEDNMKAKEKEREVEKTKLEGEIERLKASAENTLEIKKGEIEKKYAEDIRKLQSEIETLKATHENELKLKESEVEKRFGKSIDEYKEKLRKDENALTLLQEKSKTDLELAVTKLAAEKDKAFAEEKEKLLKAFEDEKTNLQNQVNALTIAKSARSVKVIGEDLESWCDNTVRGSMQNGFLNCTWEKDNTIVRNEDESQGSKADFIFKVYSDEAKNGTLLASLCLDMKDENPNSTYKKANSDYFKRLDLNRKKKECRYAVLVSNLETDKPNDIPIYKVREYEDMYVVRPPYLLTFLNMVVSLTTRFADLIESAETEKKEFIAYETFKTEFEELKKTYLDNPLAQLEKAVEELVKQNEKIGKASAAINDVINDIKNKYIANITDKLGRFELQIDRKERQYQKAITD